MGPPGHSEQVTGSHGCGAFSVFVCWGQNRSLTADQGENLFAFSLTDIVFYAIDFNV